MKAITKVVSINQMADTNKVKLIAEYRLVLLDAKSDARLKQLPVLPPILVEDLC